MLPRAVGLAVVLGAGVVLASLPTAAQTTARDCSGDAAACGKKEFEAGVAAYQKGDFAVAVVHFQQALAFRPHPVVAFNLALAEGKSGLLKQAVARLDDVLRDPKASDQLKRSSVRERDNFQAGIGSITLDSVADSGVHAEVDQEPLAGSPPAIQVNPGPHHVTVVVDGKVVVDKTLNVNAGERVRLAVTREREVAIVMPPPARPPAQPKPKPTPVPAPTRSGLDPLWFYGAAGATVVLGAVTTWSALDTKSAYDDYKSALPTLPQADIDRRVDEGHSKEKRTNVLLGGTALAAAGTAVIGAFLVDWGKGSSAAKASVGPTGVWVTGQF